MTTAGTEIWHPDDGHDFQNLANSIRQKGRTNIYNPELLDAIDTSIDDLNDELRALSLDIHGMEACPNIYHGILHSITLQIILSSSLKKRIQLHLFSGHS